VLEIVLYPIFLKINSYNFYLKVLPPIFISFGVILSVRAALLDFIS